MGFYRFLKPLAVLLGSIALHIVLPISERIRGIPKSAYYTIDVAIYTMILSMLLVLIENTLKNQQLKIQVTYYRTGESSFSKECCMDVDGEKYGRLSIHVVLNGRITVHNNTKLVIKFPKFVTIQSEQPIFGGSLTDNKLVLNLKSMFDQNANENLNACLDFTIIQESITNGSKEVNVKSCLSDSNLMTRVNDVNSLKIRATSKGRK